MIFFVIMFVLVSENTEHLCNIGLENKVIGNYWEQKYHDIWRWKFRFSNLAWNRKKHVAG
jgi:hypothetical protein